MSDNETALDLRLLGVDLDDEEARNVSNSVYSLLEPGYDLDGVAPVLQDDEDLDTVERIEVEPSGDETALVTLDGSVRLVVEAADVDGSDNLTFYRESDSVAHVKALGVPLEVPRLVRRAVKHGERGVWE